jgi:Fic family protein
MTTPTGIAAKKRELDALRAKIRGDALDNLEHSQRIDITYTSNAIEGNTLTAGETALVLEKGIAVGGKSLNDHIQALDHAKSLEWVIDIAAVRASEPIKEPDIRTMNWFLLAGTKPEKIATYAGTADLGDMEGVSEKKVPASMRELCSWLRMADDTPEVAFEVYHQLICIQPFIDGNGATARLLMNLVLLRGGYPPVAVRPEDCTERTSNGKEFASKTVLFNRLNQTLDLYLDAARQAQRFDAGAAAS